ncbi:HlyD family efflux transporter periplasmic adaptor subunit [Cellulomonas sp. PhB143]|uniref:HlyD family efflux transporter periplasmic adaptor subunit n=1 Tax=Cellulomonas sp. PhB143 TaxID=2485186 RepID=UPI000F471CA8|nr:HlyD family efflux transporter periplasmic adaptor subunit [Cellulomonas sp. PhB143]ROS78926.1 biotin/lipoyl-binding protein [Cellulomonas sp. PhB143]
MTWAVRLRLLVGIVVVVALVAAMTLLLNRRDAQAASQVATLRSIAMDVGTDYPGVVTKVDVKEGDEVGKGDPILTLQSASLEYQLEEDLIDPRSPAYTLDRHGSMTLLAPADGVVSSLGTSVGSFVANGAVVAQVERALTMYADATFEFEPRDYARLEKGAPATITLPDDSTIQGEVEAITVDNDQDRALATLEISSHDLVRGDRRGLVASGTPVSVVVDLRDDGVLAPATASFDDFLARVGL